MTPVCSCVVFGSRLSVMVYSMANSTMSMADTTGCHGCHRLGGSSPVLDHSLACCRHSFCAALVRVSTWPVCFALHWLPSLVRSLPPGSYAGENHSLSDACCWQYFYFYGLVAAILGLQRTRRQVCISYSFGITFNVQRQM